MVDLDELAAAVRAAGGVPAAAAEIGVFPSTVSRWLHGTNKITGTREHAIREFIRRHPSDPRQRPLGHYSDEDLLAELRHRLALQDRTHDRRRTLRASDPGPAGDVDLAP